MTTVVCDDGKISIPQEVREALGIGPGTVLEVQCEAGKFVAWKKAEGDAFEKWRGRGQLSADSDTEEYLRRMRDGENR
jgi:AbrB family looped-hinge helix DNA binding protein